MAVGRILLFLTEFVGHVFVHGLGSPEEAPLTLNWMIFSPCKIPCSRIGGLFKGVRHELSCGLSLCARALEDEIDGSDQRKRETIHRPAAAMPAAASSKCRWSEATKEIARAGNAQAIVTNRDLPALSKCQRRFVMPLMGK